MGLTGISRSQDRNLTPQIKKGRWQSVVRPGAKRVTRSSYRGWDIEIIDRMMGVTIKRNTYSAIARGLHPPFHFYRGYLTSENAAIRTIHRIIDEWHNQNSHLQSEEGVQHMRRKRMAKKLFKIRHKMAKSNTQSK